MDQERLLPSKGWGTRSERITYEAINFNAIFFRRACPHRLSAFQIVGPTQAEGKLDKPGLNRLDYSDIFHVGGAA
jgi:hypothetical protein